MAGNSVTRLSAVLSAEKQEAKQVPAEFQRVLMAVRKFNGTEQLRLQTADDQCFVLVGTSFDLNRDILKALLMNRCTVSVLPAGTARVTVVIGKIAPTVEEPTTI